MFKRLNYSNYLREQIKGMEVWEEKEVELDSEPLAKFRSTLRYVTRQKGMIFQTMVKDFKVYIRRVR